MILRIVFLLALAVPLWAQTATVTGVLSMQVSLDRQGFSPGVIDGRWGRQTRAALIAWQLAHGLPPTAETDPLHQPVALPRQVLYTNYTVTAADLAALGPCPTDWLARSKLPAMPHETLLEAVAEKFHCREWLLSNLNPQIADWANVAADTVLKVPNITPLPLPQAARVQISLTQKFIRAFDATGRIIAHFPCSIAARQEKRPVGTLTVVNVVFHPNYTFDPAVFPELDEAQRGYGKLIVPPGPNNPVGTAWIGLNLPGYGIHGTPHPDDIGRTESHGCFRLANWNAERLASMVAIGTTVEVVAD